MWLDVRVVLQQCKARARMLLGSRPELIGDGTHAFSWEQQSASRFLASFALRLFMAQSRGRPASLM
eukprot:6173124-Pleurochrysis_carterae.AAC.1